MRTRRGIAALACTFFVASGGTAFAEVTGFQEYFIPGSEEQLQTIFRNFSTSVGPNMHAVISVTSGADNTRIYYDHWEDGYDFDPLNPEITADEVFVVNGGQSRQLESANIPSTPRLASQRFYDGADRLFTVGRTIAVTRASWPEVPGPNLAIVWEVYPEKAGSTSYIVPVGESFYPPPKKADDYAQVYVLVMSLEDGNVIQIDDLATPANPDATFTLNRGQTNHVVPPASPFRTTGPARVTGTRRFQAQFVGGVNQGGNNLMRSLNVPPTAIFGTEYVSPVSSFPGVNTETYVHNPGAAPITVTGADSLGTVNYTVPAGQTVSLSDQPGGRYVPVGSPLRLTSGSPFWAYGAVALGVNDYDWTFNFVQTPLLLDRYAIPWAPGSTGTPPAANGSPLFITPVQDQTYVFVDFSPGDGIDDEIFLLDRGEIATVLDPDRDNSGTRIASIGNVSIAWGEDPTVAGPTSPYFDLGYSMPPLLDDWINRVLDVTHAVAPATLTSSGGTSVATLEAVTFTTPVGAVDIGDKLAPGWDYVPGSATITLPDGSMITGAAADPAITGQTLLWDLNAAMPATSTLRVTFSMATNDQAEFGPNRFDATAFGTINTYVFQPTAAAFVYVTPPPIVNKTLYLHPDGTNFAANGVRDLDRIPNGPGASTTVRIDDGTTQTFTLTPALARQLALSGTVISRLFLDPTNGTGGAPDVTVALRAGGTRLGRASLADLDSGIADYTFAILPLAAAIPAGGTLSLDISVSGSLNGFVDLYFDSTTHDSRVEALPTFTYIRVTGTSTHDVVHPGVSLRSTFDQGEEVSVRATVRDPFGAYDITSVTADVRRDGVLIASGVVPAMVASDPSSKTFELLLAETVVGSYTVTFTAEEGTEGTVDHARAVAWQVVDDDFDDDGLRNRFEMANGTNPDSADTDGDGIQDGTESGLAAPQGIGTNSLVFIADADLGVTTTSPLSGDSDADLIGDGIEDADHDGQVDSGETNPADADTDDDLLADGVEDADRDGVFDAGETDPRLADTDADLIPDGVEDADRDGLVDATESDPRLADTDGDSLADGAEDADRDGLQDATETSAIDADSDDDFLSDGLEVMATNATDPLDDDCDDDGLLDGNEDIDGNGVADQSESDPNSADTDGDGITDGTESGLAAPQGGQTDPAVFVADADPQTTTDPLVADTDADLLGDGAEDADHDGAVDPLETDPNDGDTDDDLVGDGAEVLGGWGSNAVDDDTDDDGLLDGNEDADRDGDPDAAELSPLAFDTDADGLSDGVETGLAAPQGADTEASVFRADADPSTVTDPRAADTDAGGMPDGNEDVDYNGRQDARERDPNDGRDDVDPSLAGTGGCGCALDGRGPAGGSALLAALGALVVLASRRRQRGIACLLAATSFTLAAGAASAQLVPEAGGFELHRLHLAAPYDQLSVARDPATQMPGTISASFLVSYADQPLRFVVDGEEVARAVDSLAVGELVMSLGILRRLELTGSVPVTVFQQSQRNFYTETFFQRELATTGVNDPRVGVKLRVLDEREGWVPAVALVPSVSLPAGGSKDLMGAQETTTSIGLAAGKSLGPVHVTANGAYVLRPVATVGALEIDDELAYALGVRTGGARFQLAAELFGSTIVSSFAEPESSPAEAILSMRFRTRRGLTIIAGGGTGIGIGYGAPSARGFAGVSYELMSRARAMTVIADAEPTPAPTAAATPVAAPLETPAATPEPTPTAVASLEPSPELDAKTCKKVTAGQPVDPTNRFTLADKRVYAWVKLAKRPPKGEIHVVWFKGKTLIEDKVLKTGPMPWTGSALKSLRDAGAMGDWTVEIRDATGAVLKTLEFAVVEQGAAVVEPLKEPAPTPAPTPIDETKLSRSERKKLEKERKEAEKRASEEEREKAKEKEREKDKEKEKEQEKEERKEETVAVAATPVPTPAAVPEAWTVEARICKSIANRRAVNPRSSFTLADGKVYTWFEVTGPAPGEIHVVWFKDKLLIEDAIVKVPVTPFLGAAKKTLRDDGAKGSWKVEIRDAKGGVLKTLTFTVD